MRLLKRSKWVLRGVVPLTLSLLVLFPISYSKGYERPKEVIDFVNFIVFEVCEEYTRGYLMFGSGVSASLGLTGLPILHASTVYLGDAGRYFKICEEKITTLKSVDEQTKEIKNLFLKAVEERLSSIPLWVQGMLASEDKGELKEALERAEKADSYVVEALRKLEGIIKAYQSMLEKELPHYLEIYINTYSK